MVLEYSSTNHVFPMFLESRSRQTFSESIRHILCTSTLDEFHVTITSEISKKMNSKTFQ